MDHEKTFFPKYDEYEVLPGEDKFAREKRWDEFKNPYLTPDEDTLTKKTKDSKWFYGDMYLFILLGLVNKFIVCYELTDEL